MIKLSIKINSTYDNNSIQIINQYNSNSKHNNNSIHNYKLI